MRASELVYAFTILILAVPALAETTPSYSLQNARSLYLKLKESADPKNQDQKERLAKLVKTIRSYEESEKIPNAERMSFAGNSTATTLERFLSYRVGPPSVTIMDNADRQAEAFPFRDAVPTVLSIPEELLNLSVEELDREYRSRYEDRPDTNTIFGRGKAPLSKQEWRSLGIIEEAKRINQNADYLATHVRYGDAVLIEQGSAVYGQAREKLTNMHTAAGRVVGINRNLLLIEDEISNKLIWVEVNVFAQFGNQLKADRVNTTIAKETESWKLNKEVRFGKRISYMNWNDESVLRGLNFFRPRGDVLYTFDNGSILVRDPKTKVVSVAHPLNEHYVTVKADSSAKSGLSCLIGFGR